MWARAISRFAGSLCQRVRVGRRMGARCIAFMFATIMGCLRSAAAPICCDVPICPVEPERVVLAGLPRVECVDAESGAMLRTPGLPIS